jgi:hypothetical protein
MTLDKEVATSSGPDTGEKSFTTPCLWSARIAFLSVKCKTSPDLHTVNINLKNPAYFRSDESFGVDFHELSASKALNNRVISLQPTSCVPSAG